MTLEQADMLNRLIGVENEISTLWEYHPDNPNQTNVQDRFEELQKEFLLSYHHLQSFLLKIQILHPFLDNP